MKVYLERKGYFYSPTTVHKYMNTELGLRSIVRPKKPGYEHGKPHKVFENKLKRKRSIITHQGQKKKHLGQEVQKIR